MKTAIVLNACSATFEQEIEELNSFLTGFQEKEELEAWVISQTEPETPLLLGKIASLHIIRIQTQSSYLPEQFLSALEQVYIISKPELILFPSDYFGLELAVRFSYRTKGSCCVEAKSFRTESGRFLVDKAVYGNNINAKFMMKRTPFCLSIAKGKNTVNAQHIIQSDVETIIPRISTLGTWVKEYSILQDNTQKGLKEAKFVVAAGRGVGCKKNFEKLEAQTETLGGSIGASRPVVMNAWTRMNKLIGASGSILSPDLCITVGVSGAAAFVVGIINSKFIIAINNDEHAPIFKMADVAIVDDYQAIMDCLMEMIE